MAEEINAAVLLEVLNDLRNEMRHQRALLLEGLEQGRTLERAMDAQLLGLQQRVREAKDELETTIKGELMMLMGALELGAETGGPGG